MFMKQLPPIWISMITGAARALFRNLHRSGPSAASWVCAHCGSKLDVHDMDGTSGSALTVSFTTPNSLRFKHVVALTPDGKLSISCESSGFGRRQSDRDSGDVAGTFSTLTSSRERKYKPIVWECLGLTVYHHAQPCGCDPQADYMCDSHSAMSGI